jgi:hypothetical protein
MKSHKKIIVSDESIAERINNCGTFSGEYLDALTDQQWETLRTGRSSRLSSLQSKVLINEKKIGIWSAMEEHRFMRVKRISHREKQIRDLYFAIEPKEFRISAINDLCEYDRPLLNYYRSSILHEARNRYMAVRSKKMSIDYWKIVLDRVVKTCYHSACFAFAVYLVSICFGMNSGASYSLEKFLETYLTGFVFFGLINFAQWKSMEIAEERDRLMDWKIAQARFNIDDNFTIFSEEISTHNLFSDQEKLTGERGGELSPNRL